MTQEQKAKAYDEALEKARKRIATEPQDHTDAILKDIFPQLRDSEDERIRKDLIKYLESDRDCQPCQDVSFYDSSIAWLEKQKEPTKEELYAEAGTTEKEYIANTMKIVRAMREKQKEQKPITINQDEKEFLADEITAFLCNYDKEFDGEDPVPSEVAEHFYLLGKQAQEQKPEAKLTGWVARDKDTEMLNLYMACPPRRYDFWAAPTDLHLPDKEFPDLKWEDEPMEVEITITKK